MSPAASTAAGGWPLAWALVVATVLPLTLARLTPELAWRPVTLHAVLILLALWALLLLGLRALRVRLR